MAVPFERHVPRYPNEPGFPVEPARNLPTIENSLLVDQNVVRSLALIDAYCSPSVKNNSRQVTLKTISEFCEDPVRYESLFNSLTDLKSDAEQGDTRNSKLRGER